MALLNTPIPPEWDEYTTQSPVKLDVQPDQLWDTLTYTDNTTTRLEFFGNVRANQSLSNMTQPGFLPNPQSFLIEAIRIYWRVTPDGDGFSPSNDIIQLINTGRATLVIGTKNYGPWRLWTMPANSWFELYIADGAAVTSYGITRGREWALFPHLMISPMQNFTFIMEWPAAVDLSSDRDIEVLFDGKRAKAVQ